MRLSRRSHRNRKTLSSPRRDRDSATRRIAVLEYRRRTAPFRNRKISARTERPRSRIFSEDHLCGVQHACRGAHGPYRNYIPTFRQQAGSLRFRLVAVLGGYRGRPLSWVSLRALRSLQPHSIGPHSPPPSAHFVHKRASRRLGSIPCSRPRNISSVLRTYVLFWATTGNRTLIASSTNSSVNRYTIVAILHRKPEASCFRLPVSCAQERIRTSIGLLPLPPQGSASSQFRHLGNCCSNLPSSRHGRPSFAYVTGR